MDKNTGVDCYAHLQGVFPTQGLNPGLPWWLRWWRFWLQCGGPGFDPWVGKIPGERNGYPPQYSCLENCSDRGAWQATVHAVTESWTWLSDFHFTKNSSTNAGDARDVSLIPGSGRSSGVGNHNSLQYSCLKNSMDRGVWWAAVHGVTENWTRLITHNTHTHPSYNFVLAASLVWNSGFIPLIKQQPPYCTTI